MTNVPSKVSIIVPVYNVENYLAKCLGSGKSKSSNIEIIVINDGSKDNSGDH
jgi:glycosyltransferase involved in cell wall biosynthesis